MTKPSLVVRLVEVCFLARAPRWGVVPDARLPGSRQQTPSCRIRATQRADPAASLGKPRTNLADTSALVAPGIRDGLVIGHQLSGQPIQEQHRLAANKALDETRHARARLT